MRGTPPIIRLAAGSVLLAAALYAILAIPGLVTDGASTVGRSAAVREAGR